jgi:hypothetical protein
VTADEISGVSAPKAEIMPSNPPDKWKRVLSFSRLPLRMKLDIVIKTKHEEKIPIADNIAIPVSIRPRFRIG